MPPESVADSGTVVMAPCGCLCLSTEWCRSCGGCGSPGTEWTGCCCCGLGGSLEELRRREHVARYGEGGLCFFGCEHCPRGFTDRDRDAQWPGGIPIAEVRRRVHGLPLQGGTSLSRRTA